MHLQENTLPFMHNVRTTVYVLFTMINSKLIYVFKKKNNFLIEYS